MPIVKEFTDDAEFSMLEERDGKIVMKVHFFLKRGIVVYYDYETKKETYNALREDEKLGVAWWSTTHDCWRPFSQKVMDAYAGYKLEQQVLK